MEELICKVNGCEIKNKNEELKKENEWLKQKLQETECSPNCQWQKENEQLKWEQKQILEDNESYQKENEELKATISKMENVEKELKSQIEKMKCCGNCKWKGQYRIRSHCIECSTDKNSGWELK